MFLRAIATDNVRIAGLSCLDTRNRCQLLWKLVSLNMPPDEDVHERVRFFETEGVESTEEIGSRGTRKVPI